MGQAKLDVAKECIQASLTLIKENKSEDVIRHSFTSYLRSIFPNKPAWVEQHIEGSEAAVTFKKEGKVRRGFIDNLVDLTAVEYESDLTKSAKFQTGYGQVKDYCSSLLNKGHSAELIIGILSDTIRWKAYNIKIVTLPQDGKYGRENIELEEIESVDLSTADDWAAKKLIDFLNTYFARIGSRPLTAESLAHDLGFNSNFCAQHIRSFEQLVDDAFRERPEYSEMITKLWSRFVSYLRDKDSNSAFDKGMYADEFYILTLGKLLCANIIENKALLSNKSELKSILNGNFFKYKGITNLVEYDYFGWLNEGEFLQQILPAAEKMQEDLRAYNYSENPKEDLFGQMLAQLANRSQRILLGQEWTPKWLASSIVERVIEKLPEGEPPKLVDMCCGSGAIIVEVLNQAKKKINDEYTKNATKNGNAEMHNDTQIKGDEARVKLLTQAITGFDIDPLAVMLAKISWLLAAKDWLEPFGSINVTIPIYHADSLFAITPLSTNLEEEEDIYQLKVAEKTSKLKTKNEEEKGFYQLLIDEELVQLPKFLVSPEYQIDFDNLIDFGYDMAVSDEDINADELDDFIISNLGRNISKSDNKFSLTKDFLVSFTSTVNKLNKEGKNGIWAFILQNSYRPGLLAGQFNGLVSNPPWLALSKIHDNPYQEVLKSKADRFGIKPPGPSFLHIELATIFLLHAIDRYLKKDSAIGCITPETILNGYNHQPFRELNFTEIDNPINFELNEIWKVQEGTFKNKAIVLFGNKRINTPELPEPIPGALVGRNEKTPKEFVKITQGKRSAFSDSDSKKKSGFFTPATFKQGADIMPRRLFFHDVNPVGNGQSSVSSIEVGTSPLSFIVKDGKKLKDFRLTPLYLPDELFFDVLTSNMLTPFTVSHPAKALLPIRRNKGKKWEPLTQTAIRAKGQSANMAFKQMAKGLGNEEDLSSLWKLINTRSKLEQQIFKQDGYIVLTGTGGGIVCSSFLNTSSIDVDRLIIDQTLNWAMIDTIEEALYLTGLFNSNAINLIIGDFQPEGAFGKRHVHSLPFGVTPKYDPLQPAHQDVVEKTDRLIRQLRDYFGSSQDSKKFLNPSFSTLAIRRKRIKEIIEGLPGYDDYELACRTVYGIS